MRHPVVSRAAFLLTVTGFTASSYAHKSSITYLTIEAEENTGDVALHLRVARTDLAEALSLPPETEPNDATLRERDPQLRTYLSDRIQLDAIPAMQCPLEPLELRAEEQPPDAWIVAWRWKCPQPLTSLGIDYQLFFDLDELHSCAISARYGAQSSSALLDSEQRIFTWQLGEPPPSGFLGFLRSGIDHILFGFDHILFLISLLVMVVLARSPEGVRVRSSREAIRYALTIVTSFTVAHSLTLVWAATGSVPIPSKLVESVIALSIIYVAIENAIRPDPPRRYLVTFAFGLVHGLGFASMLRDLLPPAKTVIPALAFNLGVEVGQVAILVVVLPLLGLAASSIGAPRYRRYVLPGSAVGLSIVGGLWLIERVFEVSILPF